MDRVLGASAGETPNVALLIETSYRVRRDLLRGIAHYIRLHGPWRLTIAAENPEQIVPRMKQWDGEGLIGRISDEHIAQAVVAANCPAIALCLSDDERQPDHPLSRLSEITFDAARSVAKLAAEHFLERGFRNFAYVGFDNVAWAERRERAFCRQLHQVGLDVEVYRQPERARHRIWEQERPLLLNWIQRLPKPVGILACNDSRGRQVLEACQIASLRVPDDVAVLGVDNDEVFCDVADPPLSSVALNAESAGYSAAELLDGLMRGSIRQPRRIHVEAVGVIARRSTEATAVHDRDVAAAIKFIRQKQGHGISVDDVANEVVMSRRNLEKRFHKYVGRTILEEIQLVRLECAKRMLLETTHSISAVAAMAGFGTADYFVKFFRKRVGMSPRQFRGTIGS